MKRAILGSIRLQWLLVDGRTKQEAKEPQKSLGFWRYFCFKNYESK